jgi:hypothetical protein
MYVYPPNPGIIQILLSHDINGDRGLTGMLLLYLSFLTSYQAIIDLTLSITDIATKTNIIHGQSLNKGMKNVDENLLHVVHTNSF